MVDRERRGALIATTGALLTLIGTFLPWLRSGARNRSSYTIFDLVERLGFAPNGIVAWSLRLWPLVPLLLVVTSLTTWFPAPGRRAMGAFVALSLVTSLWVGGTAISVIMAPDTGLFRVGGGPYLTLIGVAVLAVGTWIVRLRGSDASAAA